MTELALVPPTPAGKRPTRVTQYLITDEGLSPDHLIFEGVDMSASPRFTISEVAKFFFGRSAHWIRWRERQGIFTFEGESVGTQRTAKGSRVYDLADVEKMAHALAEHEAITGLQLSNILRLTVLEARIWGLLELA